MSKFTVNGKLCVCNENIRLIDFLREHLRLTAVKDACSAGACGACTVLVEGKKARACVLKTAQLEGKEILTVEGLTAAEKSVYVAAFAQAGAVQCGFCIPGMVLAAKALLTENPEPTETEIRKALQGNICRCTGYVKIIKAIQLAARSFRQGASAGQPGLAQAEGARQGDYSRLESGQDSSSPETGAVGEHFTRVDAAAKVLGTGLYVDDLTVPGLIYARALRSKYPRALVKAIDITKAEAHPDCVRILLAADVPYNKCGHIIPDWDVLIPVGSETRYVGDAIALVAASQKESLAEILGLIEVDYQELEPLCSPKAALAADAPQLHPKGNLLTHEKLHRGDVAAAFATAAHIVTRSYTTPMTDHAFMEPESALAVPEGLDKLVLYTGGQSVYDEQHEIARMLNLPPENIRCISQLVGGGFGGKEDMSVQHHAALMAYKTQRPVKITFTRQESLEVHVKRHAMEIDISTACDAEGNITATKAVIYSDCGAYASLGAPVLQRACTHAGGPYHFSNFEVDGYCVYTNNVPGGAFRGFGVTQSCFAQEQNLNLLAEAVGLNPLEFRLKNAIRAGEALPNGQIASAETAYYECLQALAPEYYAHEFVGLAGCLKNSGIGVGLSDIGRCNLKVEQGRLQILTSAADIGQGVATVAVQIVAETCGLDPSLMLVLAPDTALTPDCGTTTASRQTLFCGEAARQAALKLQQALLTSTLAELEGQVFTGEFSGLTDKLGSDKEHPVSHVAYSYGAQLVVMNAAKVVTKVVAAYDVGQVINPASCEGQVEGGIVMGLGFALTEDFRQEAGYVMSKYATLGLWRSTQVPELEVHLLGKANKTGLAYGAKGIGEIACIPTAPAAAAAARAVDGQERLSLPLDNTSYRK